ncbi:MAG: GcrA family cell cycle regulator, partial [Pseudomonadota bacterium]
AAPKPEPAAEAKPAQPARDPQRPNKPLVVAGQPLPPQPSNSEISEETRANLIELEKKARKLTLMQLTERTCKWPIGDPATEEFWFCGLPVKPGKPYCETHVAVAFQPMSSRRDRKTASR